MSTTKPLTQLQLDVLELEATTWAKPGEKESEFLRRHPGITRVGYDLALRALVTNPRAYEHDGGRYAVMLNRLRRLYLERFDARLAARSGLTSQLVED